MNHQPDQSARGSIDDVNSSATVRGPADTAPAPKKSRWSLKKMYAATGLDRETLLKMMKGSLPPTIVIAMYQSSAVSDITTTIGYLTAIVSVASQCLLPRAKFIKIMVFDLLATCVGASLCCLAIFSAIKARQHTTPSGGDISEYNSSACAVCAIWLFFGVWLSNTIRAQNPPERTDPTVLFSIFTGVTLTRAGQFLSLSEGLLFVKQLLCAFLLGMAIATGVSLLILPDTSRRGFFRGCQKFSATVTSVLENQVSYLHATQEQSIEATPPENGVNALLRSLTWQQAPVAKEPSAGDAEARSIKSSLAGLIATHSKMRADLLYAKDEVVWGKLQSKDLQDIFVLLRSIMLPLAGLSMLPDTFKKLIVDENAAEDELGKPRLQGAKTRKHLLPLRTSIENATQIVATGMEHALMVLEISSKHNKSDETSSNLNLDVEAKADRLIPGSKGFASNFQQELQRFYTRRQYFHKDLEIPGNTKPGDEERGQGETESSEDFFVLLSTEHLLDTLLQAIFEFVKFADRKREDGTMSKNSVIIPQTQFLKNWFFASHITSDETGDKEPTNDNESMHTSQDNSTPDRLAPVNAFEKCGNILLKVSRFLSSDTSIFGFRAAIASFTVTILAFLHQTQTWFFEQRLIWVMIVIVIGMNPTTGASLFGFVGRILATTVSLVLSLIAWYIVNGHTAGVLVFLYLANMFEYYFYIKYPQFFGPCVISIVTLNVIVAYELDVKQIGIAEAESNGQPYYPIYLFGPYKLLCVIIGCFISLIWTIFPYPISARSRVRKLLGHGLFVLANFYSCMHTTIDIWINPPKSADDADESLAALYDIKSKLFAEEMSLLTTLRMQNNFTIYEPPIGGKFPKATYDEIIAEIQNIVMGMALMSQATKTLEAAVASSSEQESWLAKLAEVIEATDFNSHTVTSLLCHLSAAVSNGSALPPYLIIPKSFPLTRRLHEIDGGLLSVKHASEPAFCAFASLEVLSSLVNRSLTKLVKNVTLLVGEVNFDRYVRRKPLGSRVTGNDDKLD